MALRLDRRAFLVGSGICAACRSVEASRSPAALDAGSTPEAGARTVDAKYFLFDAYPALARSLPRVELGPFPSPVEAAPSLGASLWIKRDDDFTRSASWRPEHSLASLYGGGKVRKLELYLGEARAQGKRRLVTSGGTGSNQAVAVALLGKALGFDVQVQLAPQPKSPSTTKNVAADLAAHADVRLVAGVNEAHAQAVQAARTSGDTYVIPPGGTTPLGTLGFVNAGLELADDVRAGRLPRPHRVYIALGLGGSATGLALGFSLAGLATEVVAVRASNPGTVGHATLKAIHAETIAFARARDPSFPSPAFTNVRIDDRFVGGGYGVPTRAGDEAVERARARGIELDPVYTGKAFAAVLADASADALFWTTASSRPLTLAPIPAAFR